MSTPDLPSDQELIDRLAAGSESAMEQIFRTHYVPICRAAYRILPDPAIAEDLAQDVLLELWRRRHELKISGSLGAYLRRAIVNRSLNYVRDRRLHLREGEEALEREAEASVAQRDLEAAELEEQIEAVIESLPDRCRLVFVLSRYEELSYAEIASELDISVRTVENQISKALKILRNRLAPYIDRTLVVLMILFF